MTQQRLSEKVDCNLPHISNIETGAAYPSVRLLLLLFKELGVTPVIIEEEAEKDAQLTRLFSLLRTFTPEQLRVVEQILVSAKALAEGKD